MTSIITQARVALNGAGLAFGRKEPLNYQRSRLAGTPVNDVYQVERYYTRGKDEIVVELMVGVSGDFFILRAPTNGKNTPAHQRLLVDTKNALSSVGINVRQGALSYV